MECILILVNIPLFMCSLKVDFLKYDHILPRNVLLNHMGARLNVTTLTQVKTILTLPRSN
jgi:hypothetical protein